MQITNEAGTFCFFTLQSQIQGYNLSPARVYGWLQMKLIKKLLALISKEKPV